MLLNRPPVAPRSSELGSSGVRVSPSPVDSSDLPHRTGAHARGDNITTHSIRIGPALIFQRLWQSRSIDAVLAVLLKGRRFEFSIQRALFLTVLHRLFVPGSDRAADKWKGNYAIEGAGELDLHHLNRSMA